MGPPPPKRRRKLVVLSSEDDEDDPFTQEGGENLPRSKTPTPSSQTQNPDDQKIHGLPTRLRRKPKPVIKPPRIPPTPSIIQPSSKKPAPKSHNFPEPSKSSSLDTYLNRGSHPPTIKAPSSKATKPETTAEEEDFIEDDSFDEELQKLLSDPHDGTQGGIKQISAPAQPLKKSSARSSSNILSGSQVFRKLGNGVGKTYKEAEAVKARKADTRPWAERYGPVSLEELAVHKKKIADVSDWLHGVFQHRSKKKILVLKGASGGGKTATVSSLANAMDVTILEWANPTVTDFSSDNYVSTTTLFEDFLRRSGKYTSLDVSGGGNAGVANGIPVADDTPFNKGAGLEGRKKVVLVEEVPNMFMSSSAALQSFRSSILRYLAASQAQEISSKSAANAAEDAAIPLIMIVTESQLTNSSSITDNFTAYRLLGPDILNHPNTDTIEFNPIAPTFITKALNLVIQKEARDSGRRRVPGPSVLRRLSESGDVRSAIGSLEFLCLKSQDADDWGGRVASKGKKGAKTASSLTEMEEDSLQLVTQREASLGLFHAVGKVVYNKREGPAEGKATSDAPAQPPDHLQKHVRLKPPDLDVDQLVDETGTDTLTFVAALHENYVASCDGMAFLDRLDDCIGMLSDSDILISSKRGKFRSNHTFQGVGTDSVRQDEIAFQVAVRGLLFALPCPVRRGGLPSSGTGGKKWEKGDAFKMFYPTSMRLGRRTQEVEELVEKWMVRKPNPAAPTVAGMEDGVRGDEVASWGQRTMGQASEQSDAADGTIRACITPAKDELVREVLPYMAMIEHRRPHSRSLEELKAITKVTGEVLPTREEYPDEMDTAASIAERTVNHALSKPGQPKAIGQRKGIAPPSASAVAMEQAARHLYLSDDDIED
ncbi:MAG: hypothetical protein Q9186_001009 [Xanthomendoza sp. 1 TL-2023]